MQRKVVMAERVKVVWLWKKSSSRRAVSGLKPVIENDSLGMNEDDLAYPEWRGRVVVAEVEE